MSANKGMVPPQSPYTESESLNRIQLYKPALSRDPTNYPPKPLPSSGRQGVVRNFKSKGWDLGSQLVNVRRSSSLAALILLFTLLPASSKPQSQRHWSVQLSHGESRCILPKSYSVGATACASCQKWLSFDMPLRGPRCILPEAIQKVELNFRLFFWPCSVLLSCCLWAPGQRYIRHAQLTHFSRALAAGKLAVPLCGAAGGGDPLLHGLLKGAQVAGVRVTGS